MTNIVRVTQDMVENEIVAVDYFTGAEGVTGSHFATWFPCSDNNRELVEETAIVHQEASMRLEVLTICVVTVKNGFTFVGTSAPVDYKAFDAQKGREIARERAVEQIWKFLGFRIADAHQV